MEGFDVLSNVLWSNNSLVGTQKSWAAGSVHPAIIYQIGTVLLGLTRNPRIEVESPIILPAFLL